MQIAERAETRRTQDTDVRHWIKDEDDLDWYQRHQRDEEEPEERRTAVWVDDSSTTSTRNRTRCDPRPGRGGTCAPNSP
ncbi:hypothetical protein [Streptomyces sp. NBC_00582]|uniref:hypothetical protein n=1 Tax=Streptomyces sp. NBC_00582 TaxID=2975783 RepID=UPI002E809679|nr:hypothetical protein [Streptomyces sp. NBC_00582]WUB68294.1 hypothetical protein OG852_49150 [Streptomyces sp. NBC_00582]WUB68606.1 hypothetical protein OG852_50810 [Streptomyces sp. NBC_00582]